MTSRTTSSLPQSHDQWTAALGKPGVVLLPLRLFLGLTFCFAGLQKLADPHFFDASRPTSIQGQLASFKATSPIGFLLGPISHHAVAFGVLTAVAELGVGIGTLLGLWSRAAALVGAALSLSFYLTVSWRTRPYYYGSDIVFTVMWLPFILVGSAGFFSLDAWRRSPAARPATAPAAEPIGPGSGGAEPLFNRRAIVASGAVAAGGLALAGIDAAVGRGFAHDKAVAAEASNTVALVPPGSTAVTTAAAVDAAGGVEFKNPSTGDPAYVVKTGDGSYAAFSAICTHAGCTVAYVKKARQFQCPCHGGVYDAQTGKVLGGPPPAPLPAISVKNVDGQIQLGT